MVCNACLRCHHIYIPNYDQVERRSTVGECCVVKTVRYFVVTSNMIFEYEAWHQRCASELAGAIVRHRFALFDT